MYIAKGIKLITFKVESHFIKIHSVFLSAILHPL